MNDKVIHDIPLSSIVCSAQVRSEFSDEALATLAATIKEVGVAQPVTVREVSPSVWEVIVGERRVRAAVLAGRVTIPAMVIQGELSETDILELQLLENCAREDLNPVDKARAFDRWVRTTNKPAALLAHRVGMSPGNLTKITSVLLLASDVLTAVQERRIPMSCAYELARVANHTEQRDLAQEIIAGHLTRDKLAARVRAMTGAGVPARPRKTRPRQPRLLLPLGPGRSVAVTAPEISLGALIGLIGDLFATLTNANAGGLALADVVKQLSGNRGA